MSDKNLKPCPFCGEKTDLSLRFNDDDICIYVVCLACRTTGPEVYTIDKEKKEYLCDGIALWNWRYEELNKEI